MQQSNHPLPNAAAHRQVADVAKGLAGEIYDRFASASNEFYHQNPSRRAYVRQSWPLYCEAARATLTRLLAGNISEHLKEAIHEALVLDNDLRATRERLQIDPS